MWPGSIVDEYTPWSAGPDSFSLLRTALRIQFYLAVLVPFCFCVLLSPLYAIDLECAEEGNAEGNWDRLPFDGCVFEGRV